jgi:hypothetical protein
MATPRTAVAVYGIPAGQSQVQRLGSGMLADPELVVVDPPLDAQLASPQPPRVLRVGLASAVSEEPFVELREVRNVLESVATRHGRIWALGLTEPARSPTMFGPDPPVAPDGRELDADTLADLLRRARPHLPDLPIPPRPPTPPTHPRPPHGHPATLWCRLFPHAWFCRQRA